MRRALRFLPPSPATAFWLVAAIACLVDLLVIWAAPWTGISRHFGGWRHDGYLELARNLLAGNGFVFDAGGPAVLHRPPLYPMLLVPLVALPEPVQRPVLVILQSGLLGGVAAIVWKIGSRLFNEAVGRVAVGVLLLDPWLIWVVKNPMSIILQTILYTTFCWLLLQAFRLNSTHESRGFKISSGLGLLLGLNAGALALVHGTMILTCGLLLAGACLLCLWQRDYRSVASVVVAGTVMLIVIAPWTARNWAVSGKFIPVVSNSGLAYVLGNAHWGLGNDRMERVERQSETAVRATEIGKPADVIQFSGSTDPALETEFNRRMIEHIWNRPKEFLLKCSLNAAAFYFPLVDHVYVRSFVGHPSPQLGGARQTFLATAITVFNGFLWILCWVGILFRNMTVEHLRAWLSVLVLIAVFPVAYLPFLTYVGHAQYVLPTIPLLSVLAAVGLGAARPQHAGDIEESLLLERRAS